MAKRSKGPIQPPSRKPRRSRTQRRRLGGPSRDPRTQISDGSQRRGHPVAKTEEIKNAASKAWWPKPRPEDADIRRFAAAGSVVRAEAVPAIDLNRLGGEIDGPLLR